MEIFDVTIEEKKQAVNNIIAALSCEDMNVSADRMSAIQSSLNSLFPCANCKSVGISLNTDKLPFGIYLNPDIDNFRFNEILFGENSEIVKSYDVDIDSKLFDLGFSAEDITEMLLHDVSVFLSVDIVDKVKALIDIYALYNEDYVSITDSQNQAAILIYAIKDTMYKLYSCLYGTYDKNVVPDINEELKEKISKAQYLNTSIYNNFPKVIILQWAFMIYKNMKHYSVLAKDALNDAKSFTGSTLIKKEIDKVISCISRINFALTESATFDKTIKENTILNELSIFKSLKASGLRAIENDYYEYAIRVKSASDENEAMYTLRGINTRINILSDYIWNTPNLSDAERKHWEQVIMMYQDLRVKLTKKNIINKKQYGLYFDYNQLDSLDAPQQSDIY